MFGFEIIAAIALAPLVWALIPHKTTITYIAPVVSDFNTWKYTRGHVILKETR